MAIELPNWYYSQLDNQGFRSDKPLRPELNKGIYEFVVPKDYYGKKNPDVEISLMICLEFSRSSISNGLVFQTL
jgi:hypothetical protein